MKFSNTSGGQAVLSTEPTGRSAGGPACREGCTWNGSSSAQRSGPAQLLGVAILGRNMKPHIGSRLRNSSKPQQCWETKAADKRSSLRSEGFVSQANEE